jgi:hypothetical protein
MVSNVVEPGYMRPRRGVLESDEILAKDSGNLPWESGSAYLSLNAPIEDRRLLTNSKYLKNVLNL